MKSFEFRNEEIHYLTPVHFCSPMTRFRNHARAIRADTCLDYDVYLLSLLMCKVGLFMRKPDAHMCENKAADKLSHNAG